MELSFLLVKYCADFLNFVPEMIENTALTAHQDITNRAEVFHGVVPMLGTAYTSFFCLSANERGQIRIQAIERVLLVAGERFVELHALLADSKSAIATIGTERARLLFAITILTFSFLLGLPNARNCVRLVT